MALGEVQSIYYVKFSYLNFIYCLAGYGSAISTSCSNMSSPTQQTTVITYDKIMADKREEEERLQTAECQRLQMEIEANKEVKKKAFSFSPKPKLFIS